MRSMDRQLIDGQCMRSMDRQLIDGQCMRSMDRQLIDEGDKFFGFSGEIGKGETESEILIAEQDQTLQTKKYYKHKQTANSDAVNNFVRQWNTS
jgi:hypothetical protein